MQRSLKAVMFLYTNPFKLISGLSAPVNMLFLRHGIKISILLICPVAKTHQVLQQLSADYWLFTTREKRHRNYWPCELSTTCKRGIIKIKKSSNKCNRERERGGDRERERETWREREKKIKLIPSSRTIASRNKSKPTLDWGNKIHRNESCAPQTVI